MSLGQGPAPAERPRLAPRPGPAPLRGPPWGVGGSPRCRSGWRTGLESSANGERAAGPQEEKGPGLPGKPDGTRCGVAAPAGNWTRFRLQKWPSGEREAQREAAHEVPVCGGRRPEVGPRAPSSPGGAWASRPRPPSQALGSAWLRQPLHH